MSQTVPRPHAGDRIIQAPQVVTHDVDVCVVGAGPVGGALACLLAVRGARVAIVDRAALPPMERPEFDGRAYAIAAGSRRDLLEEAGIWRRLPLPSGPIEAIRVTDGARGRGTSPLSLHFDAARDGDGPFGFMVEARSLRVALNEALHDTALISVHAPDEAMAVETGRDRTTIRLRSGTTLAARLLVAAEGRRSPLRHRAGIRVTTIPYDQAGLVTAIAHEHPHGGAAAEHFLPAGPFALLPMAATADEPHVSAVVWTERRARAARLHRASEAVFAHELRRSLPSEALGAVRPIGRRWFYELSALHAERYVADRLALVGDAAHGIHPIAGQGLNLGLRDTIALGGLVADALARGEDPGGATLLARYQSARRPDALAMLAATDVLDRLFSNDRPALRLARGLGIAAVDRLPGLKRRFVRQATGASRLLA